MATKEITKNQVNKCKSVLKQYTIQETKKAAKKGATAASKATKKAAKKGATAASKMFKKGVSKLRKMTKK